MEQSIGDLLVIGAGSIGGTIGAILHKNNVDVCLLDVEGEHYNQIKANGVYIKNMKEYYKVPIYTSINDLRRKFKHIIVATKNVDTQEAIREIDNVLTEETLVYSMQNGFGNTDLMAQYIPRDQIVAGVVGWGGNVTNPGEITLTSTTGDFIIGFENGKNVDDSRLIEMQKMLNYWKPTIITNNILGYRWGKLIVNSIIATFGGLLGLTTGELLGDSEIKKALSATKEEGIRVGEALDIEIEKVDGMDIKLFFYKPRPEDNFFQRVWNRILSSIIIKIGSRRHGKIRSSLLWDLERNRKTEVDYLNGYISKKGSEVGVTTPVNDFLVKAIHEIENGKREVGLHNMKELSQKIDGIPNNN